jgi:hypothetical protein
MKQGVRTRVKDIFRGMGAAAAIVMSIGLLCAGRPLLGQAAGTGTIQGTITDATGAVVVGAEVVGRAPATGFTVSQRTTSAGTYVLSALQPGEYTVSVRAPGFSPIKQENITVNAVTVVGLNMKLQVGTGEQNVVVTAAPPALDTENGSLETTIPNSTYTALPLEMSGSPKSPLGFLTLVPGVASGDFNVQNINGGAGNSSFLYINGLPVTTSEMQGDARNVNGSTSTEVVDQFQVISSGVPAYYAGQGITNLVTKSGTNSLHGDVYENVRNTIFDAAGYFSTYTPIERQNEYGATLGGPLVHDKLFFFVNVDRFKYTHGTPPNLYSIPTPQELAGNFAGTAPIYDPSTTKCVNGVCTRSPFPKNVITSAISPIALQLAAYLPQTINGQIQNNIASSLVGGNTQNTYLGKLDGTINSKNRAYVLFQYGSQDPIGLPSNGGPQLPLPYASARYQSQIIWLGQAGETWTITPNLINVFGAQFNRFETPFTNPTLNGGYPAKAGLTGMPIGPPSSTFPEVDFNGPDSPTDWAVGTYAQTLSTIANTYAYQDNMQWVHGKHSITVGGQIILQEEQNYSPNSFGGFSFSNTETAGFDAKGNLMPNTGNAVASYLLGLVDHASLTDTSVQEVGARYKDYAIYGQDDWKPVRKLTVNLGLRYIIAKPFTEVLNRDSWFNPNLNNPAVGHNGALQFAGSGPDSCNCNTQVQTHYLTFDPRVGAAYMLNNKMVLRASYSINHFNGGALGGNASSQGTGLLGYAAYPSFQSPDAGITPAFNWNSGLPGYTHPPFFDPTLNTGFNTTTGPTAGGVTYNRPDTAGRSPYTENWNLTVEQAFTPTLTWSLSYAGSQSHGIGINGGAGIYSNQIDPKYLALGALLQQTLTPATLAEAQQIFPGVAMPYTSFAGTVGQALRPFPQYSSVNDQWAQFASGSYNSLQTSLQKRMSNGLYFLASYTWSKNQNNTGGVIANGYAAPRSAYNFHAERSISVDDYPHQFSLAWVYALPLGKGHRFGNSGLTDAFIGGWQLSGINRYTSGTPLGTINAACVVPYANTCYADYGAAPVARINGKYGSGNPHTTTYIDKNAFQNPAPYTFGNTPRTMADGLRNPLSLDEDVSIAKNFHATQRFTIRLQADAFNVFNRTVFGGIDTNINDTTFGQVSNQSNSPRQMQMEAYIKF